MYKLCPINFKIGLLTNLNVNGGQNKFEVNISKNDAKLANIWLKIGQLPLWRATSNGHKSVITRTKLNLYWIRFCFFAKFFVPRPHMATLRAWSQNSPQNFGTCPGLPLQLLAQNRVFKNDMPEPPPLTRIGMGFWEPADTT